MSSPVAVLTTAETASSAEPKILFENTSIAWILLIIIEISWGGWNSFDSLMASMLYLSCAEIGMMGAELACSVSATSVVL